MPDQTSFGIFRLSLAACAGALGAGLLPIPAAAGQDAGVSGGGAPASAPVLAPTDAQLLEDFNHYVLIANVELARANAQALLDRDIGPARFLALIEDSATLEERFDRSYRRALVTPGLEDVASKLALLLEEGRLSRARSPEEIARNITLLTGGSRAQLLARQRLLAAGEYAVPQLLEVLLKRENQPLRTEVTSVLILLGHQAVAPLCVALPNVDAPTQETLARVLGRIGYPSALPFLVDLQGSTSSDAVRLTCETAIQNLRGAQAASAGAAPAELYRLLGEQYYGEPRSLTSFPGEPFQLMWSYRPELGLQPTAVRTEVFHEGAAMALAEKSLKLDPSNRDAVGLWLSANFSRELDQPADYENPIYAASRRDAMYYAVAAGPQITERVLARALADRDTPLALRAIEALARISGSTSISGADSPLVAALTYPERRVRLEAALALGAANPARPFDGGERVVPTLASAIRDAARRYAVVLSPNLDRQQALRNIAEGDGYIVLPPGSDLASVSSSISEAPGVDLIIAELPGDSILGLVEEVRRTSRLEATPVLGLVSPSVLAQLGVQFENERLTRLGRELLPAEQTSATIDDLVRRASGEPISEEEAEMYADRCLDTLRTIAVRGGGASSDAAGSRAFDIADAALLLIDTLATTEGELRLEVADVLSFIGQQRAQVALMDAAMSSTDEEQVQLLNRVNDSAKRFGNLLEDRQVRWLLQEAESSDPDRATLAASLVGALSLPNDKLVPLITAEAR